MRIPDSRARRGEPGYSRLIYRVFPQRENALAFDGVLLRSGAHVDESALRPTSEYPALPLVLEFAGSLGDGRGHRRSQNVYVLWRLERGAWREVARAQSVGTEWVAVLLPAAVRELAGPREIPHESVTRKVLELLDTQLALLRRGEQREVIARVYELVAARCVALDAYELAA